MFTHTLTMGPILDPISNSLQHAAARCTRDETARNDCTKPISGNVPPGGTLPALHGCDRLCNRRTVQNCFDSYRGNHNPRHRHQHRPHNAQQEETPNQQSITEGLCLFNKTETLRDGCAVALTPSMGRHPNCTRTQDTVVHYLGLATSHPRAFADSASRTAWCHACTSGIVALEDPLGLSSAMAESKLSAKMMFQ